MAAVVASLVVPATPPSRATVVGPMVAAVVGFCGGGVVSGGGGMVAAVVGFCGGGVVSGGGGGAGAAVVVSGSGAGAGVADTAGTGHSVL